jgi:tetratricopeptide (TPR) repeat protein
MAVFGVPTVHEDDALRAVRAALEIRTRLQLVSAELEEQRGASIAWRTGINTGEVVAGDAGAGQRFVTGDAVNVAARLEQAANAAEILLGPQTYGLVRDGVTVEPIEPVAAKGKSEPVTAYRLLDIATKAGSASTGSRLESPMIGRRRQQRQLAEAFAQVVDERVGYLFTILGSAGVGKSRLVTEFLGSLGEGAQVLHGRCLSYGEGITYWPIAESVRQAADLLEEDDDETVRRKLGAVIADDRDRTAIVERVGQLLGRFSGSGSREETFWAVRSFLESLAATNPVVLLLDDIHWAEPTLLDLIEYLADWIRDAPVLLLCVARQELLEVRPDWGGGKSYASTITLDALNEAESNELMVNLLGQVEMSPDLVEKIGAAAEGNPLFVEEMIGMLIDRGYLERHGDGRVAVTTMSEVTIPPTIHALLAARLDGLPTGERAVIERGAVEGQVFHRGAVAELAPPDVREKVPAHLRALSRKELVRPGRSDFADDEAFRFRHLLIRDAAYSAMPKEARADLHARFAQWLTRTAGDHVSEYEEILGYHYEQAYRYRAELGTLDVESRQWATDAAQHLALSGQRAYQRGDAGAAVKLLRSAYELTPDDHPSRANIVSEYGIALDITGDMLGAAELLNPELAKARDRGDELGAARIELVRLGAQNASSELTVQQILDRSAALLEVFKSHGDEWGVIRATQEYGRHQFFLGRTGAAKELLGGLIHDYPPESVPPLAVFIYYATMYWGPTPVDEALARLEELDTRASLNTEGVYCRFGGGVYALIGNYTKSLELLERAREIEGLLGRRVLQDTVDGHFVGSIQTEAGNFEAAEVALLDSYERMIARGEKGFSSTVAGNLGHLYVQMGRWEEAEQWGQTTLELAVLDDVEAQAQGHAVLGRVHAARGDFEEAERFARRAVEISMATDYLDRQGSVLRDLAEVMVAAGRTDEARAALDQALETFTRKGATAPAGKVRARLSELEALGDQPSRG